MVSWLKSATTVMMSTVMGEYMCICIYEYIYIYIYICMHIRVYVQGESGIESVYVQGG